MSEPKFKIGETVVAIHVDPSFNGRVGIVRGYYKPTSREFSESRRDYQVYIIGVGLIYANVREATKMDLALEE